MPTAPTNDPIARAEAVRAIKRLQHAHAHYVLAGSWKNAAALFARDGLLIRGEDKAQGTAEIAAFLLDAYGLPGPRRLTAELIMSPVVTLAADGRTGKGRWHELTVNAVANDYAGWTGGIHENGYVLEDGVWKIACLHYHPQFAGPYQTGWHGLSDDPQLIPYHYSPADTGRPSIAGCVMPPTIDGGRLTWLEDEAAIIRLQNAWGYYVDRRQWDDVADLFAADGRVRHADNDIVGVAEIRLALEAAVPAGLRDGELNDHLLFAPVVTPGQTSDVATARGIVLGTIGVNNVAAQWTIALYDNDYVKEKGVWKIAVSRCYTVAATDYYRGWAESQIAEPSGWPFAAAKGDKCFPNLELPEIRFPHPVSDPLPERWDVTPGKNAERRLAVASAHDAVENIACAYGYYIDEFRWHEVAEIFSLGGWKELSYIGTYVGRERVLGSLIARYGDRGRTSSFLAIHQKIQPVITVSEDARTARIHLRLFQVGALPSGPGPFIGGVYEDEAELENGIWKISGMDLDYIWFSGYAEGWGRVDPSAARVFAPKPDAMEHYPPDGPLRGPVFSPFPGQEPLPFHFRNPVSGRSPPLLLE